MKLRNFVARIYDKVRSQPVSVGSLFVQCFNNLELNDER